PRRKQRPHIRIPRRPILRLIAMRDKRNRRPLRKHLDRRPLQLRQLLPIPAFHPHDPRRHKRLPIHHHRRRRWTSPHLHHFRIRQRLLPHHMFIECILRQTPGRPLIHLLHQLFHPQPRNQQRCNDDQHHRRPKQQLTLRRQRNSQSSQSTQHRN